MNWQRLQALRTATKGRVAPTGKKRRAKDEVMMPRTKSKAQTPVAASTPGTNGSAGEVYSLAEAAGYLRLPEAEVLRLIREQGLPARQAGTAWRLLKTAIQQWLAAGTP